MIYFIAAVFIAISIGFAVNGLNRARLVSSPDLRLTDAESELVAARIDRMKAEALKLRAEAEQLALEATSIRARAVRTDQRSSRYEADYFDTLKTIEKVGYQKGLFLAGLESIQMDVGAMTTDPDFFISKKIMPPTMRGTIRLPPGEVKERQQ